MCTEGMINLIEAMMNQAREDAERENKKNPTEKDLELAKDAKEFIARMQRDFS